MTTRRKTFVRRKSKSRSDAPSFGFTSSDLRTLRALKTPAGIQRFLDELPYNLSFTARSPKEVLRDRTASCLEGGIFAAAALAGDRKTPHPRRSTHIPRRNGRPQKKVESNPCKNQPPDSSRPSPRSTICRPA